MKKVLLCGFFILLSSTLAHGITCYSCKAQIKDRCQGRAEKCNENVDRCVTESVYSPSGQFLAVYGRCATGSDYRTCGTTLMYASSIEVTSCCFTNRCNGKRDPFPPPKCAKRASG